MIAQKLSLHKSSTRLSKNIHFQKPYFILSQSAQHTVKQTASKGFIRRLVAAVLLVSIIDACPVFSTAFLPQISDHSGFYFFLSYFF